ncbi:MAG: hypothetical protein RR212_05550 [Bacteroidales bacterium]
MSYSIEHDRYDNYFLVDHCYMIKAPLPSCWEKLPEHTKRKIADAVHTKAISETITKTKLDISRLLVEGCQPLGYSGISSAKETPKREDEKMMWEPGLSEPKKKVTHYSWKEKYKESLRHLPYKEKMIALLDEKAASFSSWACEGPILIAGFLGHVVEVYKPGDAIDAILDSCYVEDIQIPCIATSKYSAPGNVATDRLFVVAECDSKWHFNPLPKDAKTVLIALDIKTTDDERVKVIISCDNLSDVVEYFKDDFVKKLKAKQIEKFIHNCKKNVMEKYDPSLSYTKIDNDLVGELC